MRLVALYVKAYSGLSREAWMLSVIMFINRVGSMVIPFLSIYLTSELGFSIEQTGWILGAYGLGSILGSFIGGKLTDLIGHFRVQTGSLLLSSLLFMALYQVHTFFPMMAVIFLFAVVADSLRPANATSVAFYSKPENVARAYSLNRMAVNLGFSIGPAVGGMLATVSYFWLFATDATTCAVAGLCFYLYFRNKPGFKKDMKAEKIAEAIPSVSPGLNLQFIWFVSMTALYATIFFQLLATLPLYYKQVYALSEGQIGLLLALNGAIVFALEMVVVYVLGDRFQHRYLIMIGAALNGLSFFLLYAFSGVPFLVLAMIVLSISEILAMPFLSAMVAAHAPATRRGTYMGMYTMAYAIAQVLGPVLGMQVVEHFGYDMLWMVCTVLAALNIWGLYVNRWGVKS